MPTSKNDLPTLFSERLENWDYDRIIFPLSSEHKKNWHNSTSSFYIMNTNPQKY